MSNRQASLMAWSLASVSVVLFLGSVPLHIVAYQASAPGIIGELLGGVLFLTFPVVGALISARRPRNPVGWILLADGLFWNLSSAMDYYSDFGLKQPGSVPFPVGVAAINGWLWVPAVGLLGTYVFLLFPDGHLPSRKWRPLAWLSGLVITLISIWIGLAPGPLEGTEGVRNPFGVLAPWTENLAYLLLPLFLVCMLLSVLSLVLRYRRSGGEERQQIKWIAFAAALVGLLYLIAMIGSIVYPQETWFAPGSPLWLLVLEYAALLSFTLVPTSIGFAVLRYRLYDIDIIINRALVYGALTATLVLVYLGGVVSLQYVFRALTGGGSQLAVVVSTLTIAALFNPLRRRIQSLIDRRFYRRKYDASRTLERFGARLRNETDLEALGGDLVLVVREAMQPEHVSLWLRPSEDLTEHPTIHSRGASP